MPPADTTRTDVAALRSRPRGPTDRLLPHARWFVHQSTAIILGPALLIAVGLRIAVGDIGAADAAIVAVLVSVESATEWFLHRFVLHQRPISVRGRAVVLHPAQAHRRHHQDPNDPATTPIGPIGTAVFLSVLAVVAVPGPPLWGLRLTVFAAGIGLMLAYEWTHYLIHSAYRPRHRWYRHTRRAHLLHHFSDESSWYGITGHGFDRLVGTARVRSPRSEA